MKIARVLVSCTFAATAIASPGTPVKLSVGTATVSLAAPSGTPSQLASGILYGVPFNGTSIETTIPSHFFTDIGFNLLRSGGAAFTEPNRGYSWGVSEYYGRFDAALSNYRTARSYGADYIRLPHDLWGIDFAPKVMPGANGDWTSYDQFLTQLIGDIKINGMTDGLIWDIWNEPDGAGFWTGTMELYYELWARTYALIRAELPSTPITGPSIAFGPSASNPWFIGWAAFVGTNGSVPDIYSWHNLAGSEDPKVTLDYFDNTIRANNGLPQKPIHINEYGPYDYQTPQETAWLISRLERLNMVGVRANWAKGGSNWQALFNYLANLLGPQTGSPYYGAGEWWLMKYYASMTGLRVATTSSTDQVLEVFATRPTSGIGAHIMTAARGSTSPYTIQVTGLEALGLSSGTIQKRAWGFPYNGVFGEVDGPIDYGVETHMVTGGSFSFDVYPSTSLNYAYGFDLSV
ncbi:glycoside hydrolase superfamily [Aspergillus pseudoustus]|uniref:Glycoside hydrolase superfamily n=1 Tax=Aspergillus pseudoustus TaxID=1810923 RepID=A0ABR4IEH6_9EURO